jgi:hypothetical protein
MDSLNSSTNEPNAGQTDPDAIEVAEWLEASKRTLAKVWDNDEDAIYDQLAP